MTNFQFFKQQCEELKCEFAYHIVLVDHTLHSVTAAPSDADYDEKLRELVNSPASLILHFEGLYNDKNVTKHITTDVAKDFSFSVDDTLLYFVSVMLFRHSTMYSLRSKGVSESAMRAMFSMIYNVFKDKGYPEEDWEGLIYNWEGNFRGDNNCDF